MRRLLRYLAAYFESNHGAGVKVAAAAGLGLVIGIIAIVKAPKGLPTGAMLGFLVAFPAFAAAAAMMLVTADATRQRIRRGQPVGIFSRVFFGGGIWSLLVWLLILFPVGFVFAILLGNLTSGLPAG